MTEGTKAKAQAAREARLRAALRENLKRRKAQARGRQHGQVESSEAEPDRKRLQNDNDDR